MQKIVNGLNDVLDNFNDKIEFDFNFKDRITTFRDGCLYAIEKNEPVEFH